MSQDELKIKGQNYPTLNQLASPLLGWIFFRQGKKKRKLVLRWQPPRLHPRITSFSLFGSSLYGALSDENAWWQPFSSQCLDVLCWQSEKSFVFRAFSHLYLLNAFLCFSVFFLSVFVMLIHFFKFFSYLHITANYKVIGLLPGVLGLVFTVYCCVFVCVWC